MKGLMIYDHAKKKISRNKRTITDGSDTKFHDVSDPYRIWIILPGTGPDTGPSSNIHHIISSFIDMHFFPMQASTITLILSIYRGTMLKYFQIVDLSIFPSLCDQACEAGVTILAADIDQYSQQQLIMIQIL